VEGLGRDVDERRPVLSRTGELVALRVMDFPIYPRRPRRLEVKSVPKLSLFTTRTSVCCGVMSIRGERFGTKAAGRTWAPIPLAPSRKNWKRSLCVPPLDERTGRRSLLQRNSMVPRGTPVHAIISTPRPN